MIESRSEDLTEIKVSDGYHPDDKGQTNELAKRIGDIPRDGKGWDNKITKTIDVWFKKAKFLEYIYESTLDKLIISFERINIIVMVLTFLSTTASVLDMSGGFDRDKKIMTSLSSIFSALAFALLGVGKSKNLTIRIKDLSKYFATITDFTSVLEIEEDLPIERKKNANQLLDTIIPIYANIKGAKPYLTRKEKITATQEYKESVK